MYTSTSASEWEQHARSLHRCFRVGELSFEIELRRTRVPNRLIGVEELRDLEVSGLVRDLGARHELRGCAQALRAKIFQRTFCSLPCAPRAGDVDANALLEASREHALGLGVVFGAADRPLISHER